MLAFFTPNSIDTPVVTAGLLWAGGVACPANPLYTAAELAHQLRNSGAKALATQAAFLDVAARAAADAGIPADRIILLGDDRGAGTGGRHTHFSAVRPAGYYAGGHAPARLAPRADLAFLVYSSGTTGLPKGVCLSHHNIVANVLQMAQVDGLHVLPHGGHDGKGDRVLGVLPFFHIYVCCNPSLPLSWGKSDRAARA